MKIRLIVLAAALAASGSACAQSFNTGDNVLGLSFGIGGHYNASGRGYTSQSPAFGAFYEKGMPWEAGPGIIGMGAYLGYKSLRYKAASFPYSYDWKYTYTIIGLRGAYHYEFVDNLDTYGGLMLSYNVASFSDKSTVDYGYPVYQYTGSSGSYIDLTLFLGGRYYFSDQWAALLEVGYGIAYLNLGAAYKF